MCFSAHEKEPAGSVLMFLVELFKSAVQQEHTQIVIFVFLALKCRFVQIKGVCQIYLVDLISHISYPEHSGDSGEQRRHVSAY